MAAILQWASRRLSVISNLIEAAGPVTALAMLVRRTLNICTPIVVGKEKLTIRPLESDVWVFGQVFGGKEYDVGARRTQQISALCSALNDADKIPVIIDAGGNVGYTAVYLASVFPLATILTLEPDPTSFNLLKQNCAAIRNIVPIHGAVWSHNNGVSLGNTDAACWARTVNDGGPIPSYTIESLISSIPNGVVVVLKLDIEGAEREVVKHSATTIRQFPCIIVEPHDFMTDGMNSLSPLFSVLAERRIDTALCRETIMFFDTAVLSN